MTDRLTGFFERYQFKARLFYAGTLCSSTDIGTSDGVGYLHLIRSGKLTVRSPDHSPLVIEQPSMLFYPRPINHRFDFEDRQEADFVCASLDFGSQVTNPLVHALPQILLIPLAELPAMSSTLELLFSEALQEESGRLSAIERLFEYLLIQVLRHLLEHHQTQVGLLAGLADKRLAKVLIAAHSNPQQNWTLDSLAQTAGMSRARFAVHFRETVGMTPGDYLANWRVGLAQVLLTKGKSVELVANEVGYASATALSRVFKAQVGQTPYAWRKHDHAANK
ncbi:MAG: cupin domain-containing protein [Methylophilaceae bacterium]